MSETPRPLFHLTPLAGWMNDPNGLVFFGPECHLFYQAVPPGTRGKHWGHLVSRSQPGSRAKPTWEHLPVALAPDEHGEIWSGSVVADRGNTSRFFDETAGGGLVAIFTHTAADHQVQSLAYSRDGGRSWTKHDKNPVLTSDTRDFRDPKVFWYQPPAPLPGYWTMILAVGDHAEIYTSANLRDWTPASAWGHDRLGGYGVWECPDLVRFPGGAGDRWALLTSLVGPGEPAGRCETRYWLGTFDGTAFKADSAQPWTGTLLDHGPDHYAAVTWNGDYQATTQRLIGWMSRWAYADRTPTVGWQGAMTIPRLLALNHDGTALRQLPSPELELLRRYDWGNSGPYEANSTVVHLRPDAGEATEIRAKLRRGKARRCGLRVRVGRDGQEATEIGYDAATGRVYLDRTRSGNVGFHPGFAGRYEAPLALGEAEDLLLTVFVDRCSVEVFVGEGETVFTALIFPGVDSRAVDFFAEDGAATLKDLTMYPLDPQEVHGAGTD